LTGPARLALKTGAVVLPMFMIRDTKPPYWTLHILEPLEIPAEENFTVRAYRLTAAFTSTIEKAIRQWPDQWVWFHKRWHRTPETDDDPVFDPLSGTITHRSDTPAAAKPDPSTDKESLS
jgi:lauroyl/myristoyl acyltransferase